MSATEVIHMDKEAKGGVITTKCGETVKRSSSTIWWRDVTCKECVPRLARSRRK